MTVAIARKFAIEVPCAGTTFSGATPYFAAIPDIACRMMLALFQLMKTGSTMYPMIAITMIAGTSARSRKRASWSLRSSTTGGLSAALAAGDAP